MSKLKEKIKEKRKEREPGKNEPTPPIVGPHPDRVTLAIVNWNTAEMIEENIEKIQGMTKYLPGFDILVIDNCSTDDSWKRIRQKCYQYNNVFAVQLYQNMGYGMACNVAARLCNTQIIIFMNSDVYPHPDCPDWITPLVDTFKQNEFIAVVAPKLVNENDLIMGAGVMGTNADPQIRGWRVPDTGQFDTQKDCLSICGAAMMVKVPVFMELGGFRPEYRHYHEETHFCYEARFQGMRVVYQPESKLIHEHMGSCKDQNLLGQYMAQGKAFFEQYWTMNGFLLDERVYE